MLSNYVFFVQISELNKKLDKLSLKGWIHPFCNMFSFFFMKTEVNQINKDHQKFISGNLVYKEEKSKVQIEVASLCLLSLFIASITGFCSELFKTLTPVEPTFIIIYLYLFKKQTKN